MANNNEDFILEGTHDYSSESEYVEPSKIIKNKLEEFKPIKEGEVSIYVCGPTVYSSIHIGNSRPVIFFDSVVRFFKYLGYNVKYVSNFTDIDDKVLSCVIAVDTAVLSSKYV